MQRIKIIQLIDSLEIGGAERMAVNYANALAAEIAYSGIVATRKEGPLKEKINPGVNYLFLNKKNIRDIQAILRLAGHCRKNKITHLQPHGSSYATACLTKLICPGIKIIWHDHNGLSEFVNTRKLRILKAASFLFSGVVVVNRQLKRWAEKQLHCSDIIFLPNFIREENTRPVTMLKGEPGKRILCMANLRKQKNQEMLLDVAAAVRDTHPEWTFHIVGKGFNDLYERKIKAKWQEKQLQGTVFFYGSRSDNVAIIEQAAIGILTSLSEAFPLVVLEYGRHKKPVVVTAVGELPDLICHKVNGALVPSNEIDTFTKTLTQLMESPETREIWGNNLYTTVQSRFSEAAIIRQYLQWINKK